MVREHPKADPDSRAPRTDLGCSGCEGDTPPHPWSRTDLGLKFEIHGKTLCRSILGPFSYTVGVSHFFYAGKIKRYAHLFGRSMQCYVQLESNSNCIESLKYFHPKIKP